MLNNEGLCENERLAMKCRKREKNKIKIGEKTVAGAMPLMGLERGETADKPRYI